VVDNVAAGGVISPIDYKTGTLYDVYSILQNGEVKTHESHPVSNKKIKGLMIPMWNQIIDLVINLHDKVPFLPICGWDVVLSGDKIYIQELNYNPNIYAGQIIEPLLLNNNNVVEFYNYYIKGRNNN
jgi:hypothetical protein